MKQISVDEIQKRLQAGEDLNIIDVREADEVATGKIPGSIHIPLGLLEARMPELDRKQSYIIVCHSGGRSSMAVHFLERYGFDATNVTGGMLAFEQSKGN